MLVFLFPSTSMAPVRRFLEDQFPLKSGDMLVEAGFP